MPATPSASSENVFLSEQGVVVSASRFVVPGAAMYPMANITSVQKAKVSPPRLIPIALALAAQPVLLSNDQAPMGFLVFLAGLGIAFGLMKTKHVVRIMTAGGQVDAIVDVDESRIDRVVAALHTAVMSRG